MNAAGLRSWVFDLDNTLYPATAAVYDLIGVRMTDFIARTLEIEAGEALVLRERYFHMYGATVVGLQRHHGVNAQDFLDEVHDVPLEVAPDSVLADSIARLPGRKFVFTNGARAYALRVLDRLGLSAHFDDLCAIEDADLAPKPQPAAFYAMQRRFGIDPASTLFIDDHIPNVRAAVALGYHAALIGCTEPPDDLRTAPDLVTLLCDLIATHEMKL
jgi:putative hydrolase of the HAD superfamily